MILNTTEMAGDLQAGSRARGPVAEKLPRGNLEGRGFLLNQLNRVLADNRPVICRMLARKG